MDFVELDDLDRRILNALQEDAGRPTAEIARLVGLSASPCWRRIKRLEDEGVILRRVALIDQQRLGLDLTAFAHISLASHERDDIARFHERVQAAPEVVSCYAVTGNVDFIIKVVVRDIRAYDEFLTKRLLDTALIRSVNTTFALRTVKTTTALHV
ncbi:MAG: Lrp/AsnC family transcriptional regulator [Myxococcota bacterium]